MVIRLRRPSAQHYAERRGATLRKGFPVTANPLNSATEGLSHPIVFFDGVCGLCNHSVNWLLARDPEHRLRFSPLQGTFAEVHVPSDLRRQLDTIILLKDGTIYVRTAAVSRILMCVGGRWSIFGRMLWLIPWPVRDLGYRIVARLRYRLFGKHDTCRLPTPQERAVFLD